MPPRRFNPAQRVVAVVGLGLALYVFGVWATAIGVHPLTGWVGYAPLSGASLSRMEGGLHPWVRLVLWLILIAVWASLSFVLLREKSSNLEDPGAT
jgi:hypothetical protein